MDKEQELIIIYRSDKSKALKLMHEHYADFCFLVAMRYLRNQEDAEEVVMDSFLAAFKKLEKFSWTHAGCLKGWFKKVTINNCLMLLRKKSIVLEEHTDETMDKVHEINHSELTYSEILGVIHSLPQQYKIVFQLHEIDGYSHPEISQLLNLSIGTCKSYLNRSRTILKANLIPLGYKYE